MVAINRVFGDSDRDDSDHNDSDDCRGNGKRKRLLLNVIAYPVGNDDDTLDVAAQLNDEVIAKLFAYAAKKAGLESLAFIVEVQVQVQQAGV